MARKAHKPTAATRRRVTICAGGGMSHESIAQVLRVDPKTLRKHYESELASGANERRAQVLETLFAQARKGSTSAARLYLRNEPQFEPLSPAAVEPSEPKPEKPNGKKEQAQADAVGAESGTGWDGVLPRNVVPIAR